MELKTIPSKIYEIRGQKVMLDFDLANLYGVQTKVLNQAAKRNHLRFPNDFMFRLTKREWEKLDTQVNNNRSQNVTSLQKHRSSTALPFAFTEQGVAMLSSVLNSLKAIKVNIAIMRAFVFIRQYALSHIDLTQKLKDLETKYDRQFKDVYEAINFLLQKDKLESEQKSRKRIGFKTNKEK
jgi:hypothetical protein